MPISPDQACEKLTHQEKEAYDAMVFMFDTDLADRYQGVGDTVRIEFLKHPHYTERVRTRLFRDYMAAGWGKVEITSPAWPGPGPHYATFTKDPPRVVDL
jgi:hypothetical protein